MSRFPVAFTISLFIHVLFAVGLIPIAEKARAHTPQNIQISLTKQDVSIREPTPPPQAAPAKPPAPKTPDIKKVALAKKAAPLPRKANVKTVKPPTIVQNSPPKPASAPKAPKIPKGGFSLDMSATVSGGNGIAVAVSDDGGNFLADPNRADVQPGRPDPVESQPRARNNVGRREAAFTITKKPEIISNIQATYPPTALQLGLEADILLSLEIGPDGLVRQVSLVKGAGNGFDEAAIAAVKKFLFRPAYRGATPISIIIPWTYKFRIEQS
jgi:TonB family protein